MDAIFDRLPDDYGETGDDRPVAQGDIYAVLVVLPLQQRLPHQPVQDFLILGRGVHGVLVVEVEVVCVEVEVCGGVNSLTSSGATHVAPYIVR